MACIELDTLSVRHPAARGNTLALDGVSLRIEPGEQVAVIGPSGAGKTTLLQAIACALRPAAGRLRLMGMAPWALARGDLHRLRARLFLAPQVPPLPPRQRVVTAVLAGRLPQWGLATSLRSLVHPVDADAALQALQRFDMAGTLFERVDRLSGGERQRVGLARALLARAELLLVDEPLSSLDPARAAQAIAVLCEAARADGATLVTSLHQVDVARARFERIVALRDGRLLFDLPAALVDDGMLRALYADHEHERADAPVQAVPPLAAPGDDLARALACR